ncbi:MAG: guanylate kinase [Deltaproteobacteria bacterium]|nr:guanylate kinase [Deltaproteobacteria bacterium]
MSNDQPGRPQGLLLTVSAPSGAGKTTICREFLRLFPDVRFSVSCTTRPPRPGEVDGKDYVFLTKEAFRERIDRGEFVEWVENYGELYGTSKKTMDAFLEQGTDLLLDIEPRGARAIREHYPRGVFVFILPPSLAELKARLSRRGESPVAMERRLRTSQDEIGEALWYDYVIFNETLKVAVDQFRSIYVAERCRRDRLEKRISAFLDRAG